MHEGTLSRCLVSPSGNHNALTFVWGCPSICGSPCAGVAPAAAALHGNLAAEGGDLETEHRYL